MAKMSLNFCSLLLSLLIASKFAVSTDADISYQIREINNKLTYLQGRLDLFDYITDGNVSVLLHRVEVKDLKCPENGKLQMDESNVKLDNLANKDDSFASIDTRLNGLESKFNALATTLTNLVGGIKELLLKQVTSSGDAFPLRVLNRGSGIYTIKPTASSSPFDVYYLADHKGGLPWLVVQRRVDGSVDFHRNWTEYQRGFGDLENNFFIGLDKLNSLTTEGEPQELWVMLTDPDGITANAYYDRFTIGNKTEMYTLAELGKYSGDAGDSLANHKSTKFSTYDNINCENDRHCAQYFKSAWWITKCLYCPSYLYKSFHRSHLNGKYGSTNYGEGLVWSSFRNPSVSMKYTHMAIRPARK